MIDIFGVPKEIRTPITAVKGLLIYVITAILVHHK